MVEEDKTYSLFLGDLKYGTSFQTWRETFARLTKIHEALSQIPIN